MYNYRERKPRNRLEQKSQSRQGQPSVNASTFVAIGDHGFDAMYVGAEAPELHLLALARLNRQWVRVHPLIRRNVGGLGRVGQNVEYSRFLDDGQKGHRGNDLLENGADFCLNFGFGFR